MTRTASLFLFVSAIAFAQNSIYVSPDGDDANAGTRSKPVRTLQVARDLARARNGNMSADLTIYLAGGVYRMESALTLMPADSGTGGHNVVYRAMAGQHPVISGGARVTGWKRFDAAKNIWSAPAPMGMVVTRQLYIDGLRAERARGRLPVAVKMTAAGYTASSDTMASWRNPSDIEFVYTGGNKLWSEPSVGLGSWTEPRCPVGSIAGTTITMAQPCWDNSTKRVMLASGARAANLVGPASVGKQSAYIENAFELLGTPGQWYLDRVAGVFYYVPRAVENLAKADVEAPMLETLVRGEGSAADPVHNIVFRGIQFSYATWLRPTTSEGFSEIQANYAVTGAAGYLKQGLCTVAPEGTCPFGAWTKTPGNVSIKFGHNIQFVDDAFVHLGGAGLDLGNGSQGNLVQGNVFTDIAANGIELGGVDVPMAAEDAMTRDNKILNNHIYEIGADYHDGIGIVVGYARNTVIQYNQLDHLPYAGISIGWGGWPDKVKQAGVSNYSAHNTVANNLIFDFMELLSDGGGIYTQGLTGPSLADGERVEGNVIRDQVGSGHGIYTDNGSCNITVSGNVMWHTNHDNWGSRHRDYYPESNGGFDPLLIEGNYWQQGDLDVTAENVTERGNHLIHSMADVPAGVVAKAGLRSEYRGILGRYFGAGLPEPPSRVAAVAGDGFALVAWNPSLLSGGEAVGSYTVTSSGGKTASISADEFRRLGFVKVRGAAGTYTVTATNAHGTSAPSLPSLPMAVGEERVPDAPQQASALAGEGKVSVHFQAPALARGKPQDSIVAYVVTVNPGGREVRFTGRAVLVLEGTHTTFGTVDGLKKGETYTFDVAAENAAGVGAALRTEAVTVR